MLPFLGYAFDADTGYPMLISEWMERGNAFSYVHDNDIPVERVIDLVSSVHCSRNVDSQLEACRLLTLLEGLLISMDRMSSTQTSNPYV